LHLGNLVTRLQKTPLCNEWQVSIFEIEAVDPRFSVAQGIGKLQPQWAGLIGAD